MCSKQPIEFSWDNEHGWPEFNDGSTYVDKIRKEHSEFFLLKFYVEAHSSSASREGWLQRIINRQISKNGATVMDPETKLTPGDVLEYVRRPWREPESPSHISVLYDDDDILIISKPSGLQVIRGGLFHQRTVLSLLEKWAGRSCSLEGNPVRNQEHKTETTSSNQGFSRKRSLKPAPVHRLGRGTSGVLVCAKSPQARKVLSEGFGAHSALNPNQPKTISKVYRALCSGIIEQDQTTVDSPIGRVDYPGVSEGLFMASPSGKRSLSRFRVLQRDFENRQTLVEVDLYTGRAHQIRIHSACMGHPLVGDPLYSAGGVPNVVSMEPQVGGSEGSVGCQNGAHLVPLLLADGGRERPERALPGDCGYSLHALRVTFQHPVLKKEMMVTAAPPPRLWMLQEAGSSFEPSVVFL